MNGSTSQGQEANNIIKATDSLYGKLSSILKAQKKNPPTVLSIAIYSIIYYSIASGVL
jgi:hypothetical protein